MAVLEACAMLIGLFVIMSLAFAFVEYMRIYRALNIAVDKAVYEDGTRPLLVKNSFIDSEPSLSLNVSALNAYKIKVANDILAELQNDLPEITGNANQPFYIESGYADVAINPDTGRNIAAQQLSPSYHEAGYTGLISKLDGVVRLSNEFTRFAQEDGIPTEKKKMNGILNANFRSDQTSGIYLNRTVLVGARAGVSLENTLIGNFMSLFQYEPFLATHKIVTLRGEISDEN